MIEPEDNTIFGKNVLEGTTIERKPWSSLGQSCPRSLIVFLSQLLVIMLSLVAFGELIFQKLMTNQLLSGNYV